MVYVPAGRCANGSARATAQALRGFGSMPSPLPWLPSSHHPSCAWCSAPSWDASLVRVVADHQGVLIEDAPKLPKFVFLHVCHAQRLLSAREYLFTRCNRVHLSSAKNPARSVPQRGFSAILPAVEIAARHRWRHLFLARSAPPNGGTSPLRTTPPKITLDMGMGYGIPMCEVVVPHTWESEPQPSRTRRLGQGKGRWSRASIDP